jgi:hypothetical protein
MRFQHRARRKALQAEGKSYCYVCKAEKPVEEFHVYTSGNSVGRPVSRCKACVAVLAKAYQEKNPAAHAARGRRSNFVMRMEVLWHYSNHTMRCACCGESTLEFLTIDHTDGDGATHRKEIGAGSHTTVYRWLRKNNYPPGYQVLCMNCNAAKAWHGKCPHVNAREQERIDEGC